LTKDANLLTLFYLILRSQIGQAAKMSIPRCYSTTMINNDKIASHAGSGSNK
jgi:hypothetical protein